ncbi:ER membrane protein complex subunit 2 [Trichomonascus vanleenenianus]|uniref:Emc2p n=1 Tax=Trichomonascus vanleenenianus TaxID=2268995 RepID=UPI003ECA9671
MTAIKERLLESANSSSYFLLDPPQIEQLYNESAKLLTSSQGSMDEETLYTLLRQHFHLALLTGNDAIAKVTIQRMSDRFGEKAPEIGVLKAEYIELTETVGEAQKYLSSRDATDFSAFKRKTVVLKQKGDYKMFIQEMLKYVDVMPTDAEAWAELAEAYVKTNHYSEAVHALQEVVVQLPQAYNMFARIGEVLHIGATVSHNTVEQIDKLKLSLQHFLRSVELCSVYVRGWSGVYVVATKLLAWPKLPSQDAETYNRLKALAEKKLRQIIDKKQSTEENIRAAEIILKA